MESRMLMPENAERKVCTRCGFVLFPGPKLVAGCFVVDAGRVLLIRRGIEPAVGKWTFPGGYVDFGENVADAALRETREEVGMRVGLGPLLGVFNDSAITVVVYLATPGMEPPSLSEEATEVRYFGCLLRERRRFHSGCREIDDDGDRGIVEDSQQRAEPDAHPDFLASLAKRSIGDVLAEIDVAAGKRPLADCRLDAAA